MSPIPDLPDRDLTALESKLAGLAPSTAGLDADRMLFEAGKASAAASARHRLMPALLGMLAVGCLVCFLAWVRQEQKARQDAELQCIRLQMEVQTLRETLAHVELRPARDAIPSHHEVATVPVPDEKPSHRLQPIEDGGILTPWLARGGLEALSNRSRSSRIESPAPRGGLPDSPLRARSFDRIIDL